MMRTAAGMKRITWMRPPVFKWFPFSWELANKKENSCGYLAVYDKIQVKCEMNNIIYKDNETIKRRQA
jgi:hypothetical protein